MKTRQPNFRHLLTMPQWLRCTVLTMCFGAAAALAGPVTKNPEPVEPLEPWHPGTITTGVKSNDAYTDGHFNISAPIYSTLGADATLSGDIVFIEPYISYGEGGEVATSLGLGWRHLFGTQPLSALIRHDGHQAGFMEEGWFVGANIFVDMLDTETDHQFWQLGLGAEIGNRYIELRGNYYIPLTERQEVDRFRTKESFSRSRTSQSSKLDTGDPFATGNTVQQAYTQSVFATTTTSTTTIERLFRRYEEGMEGWDAEIAVLVPGVDKYMDLRLIAGYYSFDNKPFGPQTGGTGKIEGWKAGVEIRPVPALILSGMWYEDDRLTGSDWTVGMQMQIPFEAGDLGDGQNFWSRIGDSFKPRRRHLAERMAEPVRRQNAAIKLAGSTEEDKKAREVTTKVKKVTRLVSQSKHQIVLADDIIFVNNGPAVGNGIQAGSPAGDGTAEKPLADIQAGGNRAQVNSQVTNRIWNVYTQGTAGGYAENVVANTGSVNFIGSGKPILGVDGRSFGKGPAPALSGGFLADGIPFFGVDAYHISGGFMGKTGIEANNAGQVNMTDNQIHGVGLSGIHITVDGANTSEALVVGNSVDQTVLAAISLQANNDATLRARVVGNQILDAGDEGINILTEDMAAAGLYVARNVISKTGWSGIQFTALDQSAISGLVEQNKVMNSGRSGIAMEAEDGSVLKNVLTDNAIEGANDSGIQVNVRSTASLTVDMLNNRVVQTGQHGIFANMNSLGAEMNLGIERNFIDTTGGAGIRLDAVVGVMGASMDAFVSNNHMVNVGERGIDVFIDGFPEVEFQAFANIIDTAGGAGIRVRDGGRDSLVNLAGNNIWSVGADGIEVLSVLSAKTRLNAFGNVIGSTTGHGMGISVHSDSTLTALLTSNQVSFAGGSGVYLEEIGGVATDLQATGNVLGNLGGDGLELRSRNGTAVTATLTGNQIQAAGRHGVNAVSEDDSSLALVALANTITQPAQSGFRLRSLNNSSMEADVTGNTVTGGGQGVEGLATESSTLKMTVDSNSFNGQTGSGILALAQGGAVEANFSNNLLAAPGGHGIVVEGSGSSVLGAILSGNVIDGPGGDHGIRIVATNTAALEVGVSSNEIHNAVHSGVYAQSDAAANIELIVEQNLISGGSAGAGIDLSGLNDVAGGGIAAIIHANTVVNTDGFGVRMSSTNVASMTLMLTDNFILNPKFTGVAHFMEDSSVMVSTVSGNIIQDAAFGISARAKDMNIFIENNEVFGPNDGTRGIWLQSNGGAGLTATVSGNNIHDIGGSGIVLESESSGNITSMVTDNVLSNIQFQAIQGSAIHDSTLSAVLEGNAISDAGSGMLFATTVNGVVTAAINGNTVTDAVFDGFTFSHQSATSTITIDSTISNTVIGEGGLKVQSDASPTGNIIINGVNVILPADLP